MPRLDTWAWLIWIAVTAAETALSCLMVRKRIVSRSPSIFAYLAIQSAKDLFLIWIACLPLCDRNAAIYFYTYWTVAAVLCLVRVWMIVDLAYATCQFVALRSFRIIGIPLLAVGLGVTLTWVAIREPADYASDIMRCTVALGRVTALGWVGTFLSIAWIGDLIGFRWSGRERYYAIGLGIQATGESLMSWFLAYFPLIHLFSNTQDALYFLSLIVWGFGFYTKDRKPATDIDSLRAMAEPYIELGQALRGKL